MVMILFVVLYLVCSLFFLVFCALLISFFFSSRRRHTRLVSDWSSDVCSSDLSPSDPSSRRIVAAPDGCKTRLAGFRGAVRRGSDRKSVRVGKECRSRGWPCD